MATFNVDPEDFTDEMSQELDDLLAQNQADQTALSREQLQRMFELRELRTALEQQDLSNQINQTAADGENDYDNDNEDDLDQGARGPARREDQDNWGLPPTQLKSHNTTTGSCQN